MTPPYELGLAAFAAPDAASASDPATPARSCVPAYSSVPRSANTSFGGNVYVAFGWSDGVTTLHPFIGFWFVAPPVFASFAPAEVVNAGGCALNFATKNGPGRVGERGSVTRNGVSRMIFLEVSSKVNPGCVRRYSAMKEFGELLLELPELPPPPRCWDAFSAPALLPAPAPDDILTLRYLPQVLYCILKTNPMLLGTTPLYGGAWKLERERKKTPNSQFRHGRGKLKPPNIPENWPRSEVNPQIFLPDSELPPLCSRSLSRSGSPASF